jgi:hypothetical protein
MTIYLGSLPTSSSRSLRAVTYTSLAMRAASVFALLTVAGLSAVPGRVALATSTYQRYARTTTDICASVDAELQVNFLGVEVNVGNLSLYSCLVWQCLVLRTCFRPLPLSLWYTGPVDIQWYCRDCSWVGRQFCRNLRLNQPGIKYSLRTPISLCDNVS